MKFSLNVMDNFTCLGGDCPSTCCQNWNISLDDATLEKWRNLEDEPLRKEVLDSLVDHPDKKGVMCMKLTEDEHKSCVQMNSEGLCQIQTKLGHENIPKTCQQYPRIDWATPYIRVSSGRLSCPAVSQTVLQLDDVKDIILENMEGEAPEDFEVQFENLVQHILCDQRYLTNIHITAIAEALCELAISSQQGDLDARKLKQILGKPSQRLYELNLKVKNGRVKIDRELAGRFWMIVYNWSKEFKNIELFAEFREHELISAIEDNDDSSEFYERYYELYEKLRASTQDDIDKLDRYCEKYLRVKFMTNGFPLAPALGNYIGSFLYCIFPMALIQLNLRLFIAKHGSIKLDDMVAIIGRIERKLDHNIRIYQVLDRNPMFLRLDMYRECLLTL